MLTLLQFVERKKAMRALLIDPKNYTITEVDYNGDYKTIYTHLNCELFDVVYFDFGDIYVDDEGLLNNPEHFFVVGKAQPLAGRGLVFGPVREDGETTPATISIDELKSQVQYMNRFEVMKEFA